MEPVADLACVLKVNVHCDACKMKMMEVMSSISGVYSVSINADEGTARVSGEVDPAMLMRALARSGKHAELVWANLKHPLARSRRSTAATQYYYGDDACEDPYLRTAQPSARLRQDYYPYTWEDRPYNGSNYYHNPYYYNTPAPQPPPAARHVPSYPPPVYDPSQDYDTISFCTVM